MDWKAWVNTVLSAASCGGLAAIGQMNLTPDHIDWKHTGLTFCGGALIGIVQHFRSAPSSK